MFHFNRTDGHLVIFIPHAQFLL